MADITEQEILEWNKQYEDNNYQEICDTFVKNTSKCVEMISDWINSNAIETSSKSISGIRRFCIENKENKKAAEFMVTTPLAVEDAKGKWSLREISNAYIHDQQTKESFIELLTYATHYILVYEDIDDFCKFISDKETMIKSLDSIITGLWKTNIKSIDEKKDQWFPSIRNDCFHVIELHYTLYMKYQEISTAQPMLDTLENNIEQLENIGTKQIGNIENMNTWLTALKNCYTASNYPQLVQEYKKDYKHKFKKAQNNEELVTQIRTDDVLKLYNKYISCFQKRLTLKKSNDDKIFFQYAKATRNSNDLEVSLWYFRKRLIEVLKFEEIKYMYVLLLMSKVHDKYTLKEDFNDKYNMANTVYKNHDRSLIVDNCDNNLTEECVMKHQISWLLSSLEKTLQESPEQFHANVNLYNKLKHAMTQTNVLFLEKMWSVEETDIYRKFAQKTAIIDKIKSILCPSVAVS